jgi:NAD(P)-dependent dehydrogenase (short-subunit alcohol dehydrogenase family)
VHTLYFSCTFVLLQLIEGKKVLTIQPPPLKAALEARQYGIRVNSLSPGFILTKIAEPIVKSDPKVFEVWKTFEARQGRQGKPEEIGDAVALLSSTQMSLVNGHNLIVDG